MKRGIIVASFGTTFAETRRLSIESIENRIRKKHQDDLVLRAFTSKIVVRRLKKRDNLHIDDVGEALEKMKTQGIKQVFIQPLHIIKGVEYEKILSAVDKFKIENKEMEIFVGRPMLDREDDYKNVVRALDLEVKEENQALVYMGHGSYHNADISYEKLQEEIDKDHRHIYMATVEGAITLEDIIEKLKREKIKYVLLKPFMIVAGDHATNDMSSDEDDSWKTILEENDIEVKIDMTSLGEMENIQNIFIEHLEELMG